MIFLLTSASHTGKTLLAELGRNAHALRDAATSGCGCEAELKNGFESFRRDIHFSRFIFHAGASAPNADLLSARSGRVSRPIAPNPHYSIVDGKPVRYGRSTNPHVPRSRP